MVKIGFALTNLLRIVFLMAIAALPSSIAQDPPLEAPSSQILSYHGELTVNHNASLLVRETIVVQFEGRQPEIYRAFPASYRNRAGNLYMVHLHVDGVECDGLPVEYSLEKFSGGLRVYLDRSSKAELPGQHTYTLSYSLNRAIGLFEDHDELYWDVTGAGVPYPIGEASATVHLPKGIARLAMLLDAYTGAEASVRTDFTASGDNQSNAYFRTTRPLNPHESLTIVVRWPKGFIRPLTSEEKNRYFLEDNRVVLTGLAGLTLVILFFAATWFVAGRGRPPSQAPPRGSPPRGLSPGALRDAWRRAFDYKTPVVNLVDLAVKRQIAILEEATGVFILGRRREVPVSPETPQPGQVGGGHRPEITVDERLLLGKLFAENETITLAPANHAALGDALECLHRKLHLQRERTFLARNSRYLIPGLAISLLVVVRCGFSVLGASKLITLIVAPSLLIASLAAIIAGAEGAAAWKDAVTSPLHRSAAVRQALRLTVLFLVLCLAVLAGVMALGWATSTTTIVVLLFLDALTYAFHCLLKSSERQGGALDEEIEGFRRFLAGPDNGRSNFPPALPKTPALYEQFLPYAMALNVEKAWSEKFASVLKSGASPTPTAYSPAWYTGRGWSPSIASNFAAALGMALSRALASAVSPSPAKSAKAGN